MGEVGNVFPSSPRGALDRHSPTLGLNAQLVGTFEGKR